jgi:hypothetical protein
MNVLDLYSGLGTTSAKGGWGQPWREAGHTVVTLDFDPKFGADHVLDILTVHDLAALERDGQRFDVVLASPPCEGFSVAAMGKNWERSADGRIAGPKHPRAELAMRIARHTFDLIDAYAPKAYLVENPIGALRVMGFVGQRTDRRSTWYCRWGETRAKPTDIWTNIWGPGGSRAWPVCRQGGPDHEPAPRGSKTGTQGLPNAAERSLIPAALAAYVFHAVRSGAYDADRAEIATLFDDFGEVR